MGEILAGLRAEPEGTWARQAAEVLAEEGTAPELPQDEQPVKPEAHSTRPVYYASVVLLITWGLLMAAASVVVPIQVADCWFVSYFEVQKTECINRSILDCRRTNECHFKPPPVRLVTPDQVRDMFCLFGSAPRGPWTATADLRHFFHQLTLPQRLWRWFAVLCRGAVYVWRRVPMGWSWAPYVCQSAATVMCRVGLRRKGFTVESWPAGDEAPAVTLIRLGGVVVAALAVYLDNLLVVANSSTVRDRVIAGIRSGLSAGNLGVKGDTGKEPFGWTLAEAKVEYLGIQYKMTRTHGRENQVEWRHLPSNCEKWTPLLAPLESGQVLWASDYGKVCGVNMWDGVVRPQPMASEEATLEVLRLVGAGRQSRTDWRKDYPLENAPREKLAGRQAEGGAEEHVVHRAGRADDEDRRGLLGVGRVRLGVCRRAARRAGQRARSLAARVG